MIMSDERPDPDALLAQIQEDQKETGGKLKIFFGYAAGVGKTFAMLKEAHERLSEKIDVVAGYVERHTRPETMALVQGIPALPAKSLSYRNIQLDEFDIDAALLRKPALILVDELAHTNAEGSRNKKRYQDVEELLNAGIDVYTTMNVQHVESLNDIVQRITGITVRETVPDYIIDRADKVNLIDIDPEELLVRFTEGKVYRKERVTVARGNFFTPEKLSSLREIALRKAADRVSRDTAREEKPASEKILVCLGPSPSSARCIRAAARMADAWHVPWVAVTVMRDGENSAVRENIALAERLGAKIVFLQGIDVSLSVSEYAKAAGITNIVIGKRKRQDVFRNPFKAEFADRLAFMLPDVEVHIITDQSAVMPYRKKNPVQWRQWYRVSLSPRHIFISLFTLTLATGLSFGLFVAGIGDHNIIMMYILGVLVISRYTEGYFYGAVSSVLAVLAFNFFFTEPYFTFNTIQAGYPVTFLIMFLVALITSAMTVRIKEQVVASVQRERRTEMLYEINNKLLEAYDINGIRQAIEDRLSGIYGKEIVLYSSDPIDFVSTELGVRKSLCENERSVVHWIFANGKPAGAGTDTLRLVPAFYTPVTGRDRVIGVIGVACEGAKGLAHDQTEFLGMVASLAALALERQTLSDRQRTMEIEAEKEKMRYDFLRGISHDLRTPLTAILGASSVLLENGELLDPEARYLFASDIRCDAQWLMRMVENVLSVTKIRDGSMRIVKKNEAVEEVVAEAASLIRSHFSGVHLNISIPDDLLMVPMDGTLIEQVLINLIENAVKYAGVSPTVELRVATVADNAVFTVIDDGEGIPEEELSRIFEGPLASSRKTGDGSRGLGIGLMICAAIVKAHNGTISARNRDGRGAEFSFTLPCGQGLDDGKQNAGTDS